MLLALTGLILAQTVAVISPGPAFVVVVRTCLSRDSRAGLWTTVGIAMGTLVWASAALFGLGLLFAIFPWLYLAMRIAGAAFLLWMAFRLWRHAHAPLPEAQAAKVDTSFIGALRAGFLTQLANPKVAVFFGSIFVTFLPPDPSVMFQITALLSCFTVELLWFGLVAIACTRAPFRSRYERAKHIVDRITAVVLAGLGARLVLTP